MKTTKRKVGQRSAALSSHPAQPPAPVPAPFVGEKRIQRLEGRRDTLLREMFHSAHSTSETNLRIHMDEFEDVVAEIARLKAARDAAPVTPYAITLDEHASRLVRHILLDDPGFTVEDVVNGAVYFNADSDHDGSPECFEAARAARLGKEAA